MDILQTNNHEKMKDFKISDNFITEFNKPKQKLSISN